MAVGINNCCLPRRKVVYRQLEELAVSVIPSTSETSVHLYPIT